MSLYLVFKVRNIHVRIITIYSVVNGPVALHGSHACSQVHMYAIDMPEQSRHWDGFFTGLKIYMYMYMYMPMYMYLYMYLESSSSSQGYVDTNGST